MQITKDKAYLKRSRRSHIPGTLKILLNTNVTTGYGGYGIIAYASQDHSMVSIYMTFIKPPFSFSAESRFGVKSFTNTSPQREPGA